MSKKNYKLNKSDLKQTDYFRQTDTPDGVRRQEIEEYNELELWDFEIAERETTGIAKNHWDQGRNCPACAGRLVVSEFEQPEETLHLRCTTCGKFFYASDLDNRSKTTDTIYRTISDRTFNKWVAFKDKRL